MPAERHHARGTGHTAVEAVNTTRLNNEQLQVYEKAMAGMGVFITGDAGTCPC